MATILIIEDDAVLRHALVEVLHAAGYQTFSAADGRAGLTLAFESNPDLILCDVLMPYLDGYRVLEQLRADPRTVITPFIFLTARSEVIQQRRGMQLGADDFITKPFDTSALLKTIKAQFEKRERFKVRSTQQITVLRQRLLSAMPTALHTRLKKINEIAQQIAANADSLQGPDLAALGQTIHASAQHVQGMIENYLVYVQLETLGRDDRKVREMRVACTEYPSSIISASVLMSADKYARLDDLKLAVRDMGTLQMASQYLTKTLELICDYVLRMTPQGSPVIVAAGPGPEGNYITVYGEGPLIYQIHPPSDTGRENPIRAIYGEDDGLAVIIARRLMEIHGGLMELITDPAQGIRISLIFPTAPA